MKENQQKRANAVVSASFGTDKSQPLRIAELTGRSLAEVVSQLLYKIESLQSHLLGNFSNIEEALIKQAESTKILKSDLNLQAENSKMKENNLLSEIDLLKMQINKLENNMRSEDIKNNRRYDEIIIKLKEEHMAELNRIQDNQDRALKDLNEQHFAEQKEMETRLIQANANNRKTDEQNEYISKLENVIRIMRERLKEFYDKQRPLQTSWKEEDCRTDVEEVLYTDFALHHANKLSNDNKWLVEKLEDFGKENEKLKEKLSKSLAVPSPQFLKEVNFLSYM